VFRRLLRSLLCLLFGAVFIYAGALKARDPMTFLDDVRSFQILPDPFAAWLALALPWFEILAGLAVITGLLRPGGLLSLNALLVVFLGAILLSWARGLDLSCGCFGDTSASDYPTLLLRDLALLALGLTCWKLTSTAPSKSTSPPLTPHN
jgi:putative oxidoreductase